VPLGTSGGYLVPSALGEASLGSARVSRRHPVSVIGGREPADAVRCDCARQGRWRPLISAAAGPPEMNYSGSADWQGRDMGLGQRLGSADRPEPLDVVVHD
jgi:hypothetical protein